MVDSDTKIPIWFWFWFAFCTIHGIAFAGLIAWAIIRFVTHYT